MYRRLYVATISVTVTILCTLTASAQKKGYGDLSQYQKYADMASKTLFDKGARCEQQGQDERALTFYSIIFNRYRPQATSTEAGIAAQSLYHAGGICYRNFNYIESMNYYLRCQDICEDHHLDSLLAETLKSIGNIYSQHTDYELSQSYYEQCLNIAAARNDQMLQHKVLYNLIISSLESGHAKEAESYFRHLRQLGDKNPLQVFERLITEGLLAEHRKDLLTAKGCYQGAITLCERMHDALPLLGTARSCLARVLQSESDYAHSIELLKQNESDATSHNQLDLLTATCRELSNVYESMGLRRLSLEYKSRYIDLHDQTYNSVSFNSLKSAQFLHDLNKSNAKVDQLTQDRSLMQQHMRQMMAIIIMGVVFLCALSVLTVIIYRQKRHLSKAYDDLFKHNTSSLQAERLYRRRLEKAESQLGNLRQQLKETQELSGASLAKGSGETDSGELLDRINNIMEHTDDFLQNDFTIDRLAQLVGSTPRMVSSLINEEYGQNFRSLLNEHRIKEAMLRLSDVEHYGNYTIRAIAEGVGYKSQSNFIAVFTKIAGIKPSMFQRLALEKASAGQTASSDEEEKEE